MLLSNECYLKCRCYKHLKGIASKYGINASDGMGKNEVPTVATFSRSGLRKLYEHLDDTDLECNATSQFCPKLFKIDYLLTEALLTPKQKQHIELSLDATYKDKEAYQQLASIEGTIVDFVNSGRNLFIHSPITGNGKTEWSLRLLRGYIHRVWHKSDLSCRALFISVPRFLMAVKNRISGTDEYADHIIKNILEADIVVFDEVATKSLTVFEHEHILSYINARLDLGKSNIYTSNLCGEELRERVGDRLYSRIVNASTHIEFFESDKRDWGVVR